MISLSAFARLPTEFGEFTLQSFDGFADGRDHLAMIFGDLPVEDVLVRMHSECLTGEVFGSRRCDCQSQLNDALRTIAANGAGVLLYLRQEGRGIGLKNKLRAYELQDDGMDTVEANRALGFKDDERDFSIAGDMLKALNIKSVKLMTNNPDKIYALTDADIMVTRVPSLACVRADHADYLQAKADKMGHMIPQEILESLKKKA